MFLFGNSKFSDNVNSGIIYVVIKSIESTNRFSGSIYFFIYLFFQGYVSGDITAGAWREHIL